MKIKISRRKSPLIPGSQKSGGEWKKQSQTNFPRLRIQFIHRARFLAFLFHPTTTRRVADDESWMIKHRPTHMNCCIKRSEPPTIPLILLRISNIFFSGLFNTPVAKTTPRERFHTFLVQVPTKRCQPEMNCHKRNTNVIVLKKQKIRANS